MEGFDDRIDQMRAGQVEATFAEFDFARFLYLHDIGFKFVRPGGVKGKDYDFGIEYADRREACADAKCRLEDTEVRADTIKNPLNKARTNNLPPDKPGIIFVKVPQTWLDEEDVRRGIYALVEGFLRNTERIVSVVVYATVGMELAEQNMTLLRHRFREFPQPLASLRQDEELGAVQGLQGPGGMGWSAPELGTCVLAGLHHAGQMNVRCPLLA